MLHGEGFGLLAAAWVGLRARARLGMLLPISSAADPARGRARPQDRAASSPSRGGFPEKPVDSAGRGRTYPPPVVAGWSSLVARQAHNLKVAGSNPAPAPNLKPLVTSVLRGALIFGFLASEHLLPNIAHEFEILLGLLRRFWQSLRRFTSFRPDGERYDWRTIFWHQRIRTPVRRLVWLHRDSSSTPPPGCCPPIGRCSTTSSTRRWSKSVSTVP